MLVQPILDELIEAEVHLDELLLLHPSAIHLVSMHYKSYSKVIKSVVDRKVQRFTQSTPSSSASLASVYLTGNRMEDMQQEFARAGIVVGDEVEEMFEFDACGFVELPKNRIINWIRVECKDNIKRKIKIAPLYRGQLTSDIVVPLLSSRVFSESINSDHPIWTITSILITMQRAAGCKLYIGAQLVPWANLRLTCYFLSSTIKDTSNHIKLRGLTTSIVLDPTVKSSLCVFLNDYKLHFSSFEMQILHNRLDLVGKDRWVLDNIKLQINSSNDVKILSKNIMRYASGTCVCIICD